MLFISFHLHVWSSPTQRILHTIFWFTYSRICCGNLPREFTVGICRKNLPWLFAARICRGNLLQEFAVPICRRNFPWLFAARIRRRNLPWLFAVAICKEILFCICDQILFIWEQTFLICEQYFLFVRFSLSIMFLSVIAEAVMGHRMLS